MNGQKAGKMKVIKRFWRRYLIQIAIIAINAIPLVVGTKLAALNIAALGVSAFFFGRIHELSVDEYRLDEQSKTFHEARKKFEKMMSDAVRATLTLNVSKDVGPNKNSKEWN